MTAEPKPQTRPRRRGPFSKGHGPFPRRLRDCMQPALAAGQKHHGFADGRLLTDWATIIGMELARHCLPLKISKPRGANGGEPTLTLRVAPGFALLVQHQEPAILERIAGYFGYRAVGRIALVQAPLPAALPDFSLPPALPDADMDTALANCVSGVGDASVRAALLALGQAMARRR